MAESNVLCYWKNGKKRDAAIRGPILDNSEANRQISEWTVARAIAEGHTEEEARYLYAYRERATRGRTRIYQGNQRSGVLPPVPYRAVRWG